MFSVFFPELNSKGYTLLNTSVCNYCSFYLFSFVSELLNWREDPNSVYSCVNEIQISVCCVVYEVRISVPCIVYEVRIIICCILYKILISVSRFTQLSVSFVR